MTTWTPDLDLTTIPHAELAREWVRRLNLKRDPKRAGRPKLLRPCPKCGGMFGAEDLRRHKPRCDG